MVGWIVHHILEAFFAAMVDGSVDDGSQGGRGVAKEVGRGLDGWYQPGLRQVGGDADVSDIEFASIPFK